MRCASMGTSEVGLDDGPPNPDLARTVGFPSQCSFRVRRITAHAFIAPTEKIVSSFGARSERGALLMALEDEHGRVGWGEVWCGMPAAGASHRLALLREFVAPALVGRHIESISGTISALQGILRPVVTLAGEPGPVAQVLAGVDCALWDLRARIAGQPLFRMLGGTSGTMRCYASGVAPDMPIAGLEGLRLQGHRAFKFKAGFDDATTLPLIIGQGRRLSSSERMMVDANCGWAVDQAVEALRELNEVALEWIEEPILPHSTDSEWLTLARVANAPLAGGENLLSEGDFRRASQWLGVIQPDVAKWGGVSGCREVGVNVEKSGGMFCPHSFGTHVAAATSAHVLAASGGRGYVEIDVNSNPLRDTSSYSGWIGGGYMQLPALPGIGFVPDLGKINRYLCGQFELSAAS